MNGNCEKCGTLMVPVAEAPAVSIAGLIATAGVLLGLVLLLIVPLGGLLTIGVALLLGHVMKGQRTVMRCPACGARGRVFTR